jgi:hypothetical protein
MDKATTDKTAKDQTPMDQTAMDHPYVRALIQEAAMALGLAA